MSNIMIIRTEAEELSRLWDEANGELTPEVMAAYDKLAQHGQQAIAIMADMRDELTARMSSRKAKAKELTELAKKDEAMLENNQKYMLAIMEKLGLKKVEVGALVVTRSDGRESVNVIDEDAVPDTYKRAILTIPADKLYLVEAVLGKLDVKAEVDKTAVKQVWKDSEGKIEIAGTEIVRKPYVTIKG